MVKKDSGQTLLIILLVSAVILTVGLAIASYTITDIKISQQEEESARVFSAAEAGIEEALKLGAVPEGGIVTIGGITAKVTETIQGGNKDFDFGGEKFNAGDLANVWLIGHNEDGSFNPTEHFPENGTVKICWGESTTINDSTPAVEVTLLYKEASGDYKIARGGYDPKLNRGNKFDPADDRDGGNCGNLAFAEDISFSGDFSVPSGAVPYLLRMRLLYNTASQPIAVSASNNLPTQGRCYESTATIETSGISRKVRRCQFFEAPPQIFDYVLFSGGELTK